MKAQSTEKTAVQKIADAVENLIHPSVDKTEGETTPDETPENSDDRQRGRKKKYISDMQDHKKFDKFN